MSFKDGVVNVVQGLGGGKGHVEDAEEGQKTGIHLESKKVKKQNCYKNKAKHLEGTLKAQKFRLLH